MSISLGRKLCSLKRPACSVSQSSTLGAELQTFATAKEDGLPKLIRPNGVYLITGGLGGIGFVLSKMLAKEGNAHLYLTGRTALPPRDEWASFVQQENADEAQRTRIKKVLELERLGATVEAVQANAGDLKQMKHVFEIIRKSMAALMVCSMRQDYQEVHPSGPLKISHLHWRRERINSNQK